MVKTGRYFLSLSALLYTGTALANVTVNAEEKVNISDFDTLKTEVAHNGTGAEKVLSLQNDIEAKYSLYTWADKVVLDGEGHKIFSSQDDERFLSNDSDSVNARNVTIEGFNQKGYVTDYETYEAVGGAVFNKNYNDYSAVISFDNVTFVGNSATSDGIYAQGGAIYNSESLTLINSSFYDNYVATTDIKDGANGMLTGGGAIAHDASDPESQLTIIADNGKSEFSGNKAIYADGEESSAIFLMGGSLNLVSQNNGLIKFDDKISSLSVGSFYLKQLFATAEKVTEDGDGGWFVEMKKGEDGTISFHVENKEDYYEIDMSSVAQLPPVMSKEEVEAMLAAVPEGSEVIEKDGNYEVTVNEDGMLVKYTFTKQDDGNYLIGMSQILSKLGSDIKIAGDASSRVEFNEQLENIGKIDVSGTNVDVNKGKFSRSTVHDGAVLNINKGAKASDTIIGNQGSMVVKTGASADNTTVHSGGNLTSEADASLNNVAAMDGSKLNIDKASSLTGDIVIDAGATLGGTYDYGQIFRNEDQNEGSLTLVGGVNDVMNKDTLVNDSIGKKLRLTDGEYNVGGEAQSLSGWDQLIIRNGATVKLEGDISMRDKANKIFLVDTSVLDLAGHSPSNYTINGFLASNANISFTHAGDGADDITTVIGNYKAYNGARMTIDVDASTNTSDLLKITGDVHGRTSVVVNPVKGDMQTTDKILFVDAPNDDLSTGAHFDIFRTMGDALVWNVLYAGNGKWYIGTDNVIDGSGDTGYGDSNTGELEDDPDYDADIEIPPYVPDGGDKVTNRVVAEAMAYMGLPSAGIEQTRDMFRNISNKVASTKVYNGPCNGFYDYAFNGAYLRNAWVSPVYRNSEVESPVDFEADISGLEAGFDIQFDYRNRTGVFASYRQGNYDFSGKGDEYRSDVGSEMDIDSYLLGLYHRYDNNRAWLMGQVFFGKQDVEISTDDGVKADTDGFEFGAGLEAGLVFNPVKSLTIEPTVGMIYTQIDYDDISDGYGKSANYSTVNNLELEAGVKVEKTFVNDYGYSKLFVKPSIIQNIGKGDVTVTSLREVEGLEDSTLARIEIGASMNFYSQWSAYINAAYTTGSDYTSTSVNAGVNYAF